MATMSGGPAPEGKITHSREFRVRRFLNWFPLGLTYAMLYMGRYNLTVAKTSLSQKLMTKEDFGIIFFAGTIVYATSFLVNGPLVDRIGGRKGMIITAVGSMCANLAMGLYLNTLLSDPGGEHLSLRVVFSVLYAVNMYFQSFGAVSILKVNVHWFHLSERAPPPSPICARTNDKSGITVTPPVIAFFISISSGCILPSPFRSVQIKNVPFFSAPSPYHHSLPFGSIPCGQRERNAAVLSSFQSLALPNAATGRAIPLSCIIHKVAKGIPLVGGRL